MKSSSIFAKRRTFRAALSVTTMFPKNEAQASSKAPVIVALALIDASTPKLTAVKSSTRRPRAPTVAKTKALEATLLLFKPFAMGMLDSVSA